MIRIVMLRWVPLAGAMLAWLLWPEGAQPNPIPVPEKSTPGVPAMQVSGLALLVCAVALVAESICIALLSGRRDVKSVSIWFAITLLTFSVFIAGPTGTWAPIGPDGPRLIQSATAEALVVLVEGVVLWRMWFRTLPRGALRALGIASLGNLVSLAIGILYSVVG